MHIDRLPTPALIVEESILRQNREAMKTLLSGSPLSLRPHYKSHKCSALAKMQMADGACGMTCAKLCEAEDLADCGIEDILIANQITDPQKIRRVAELAADCRLTVCVDNAENIHMLSAAARAANTVIHCLVEYDIGMQRCGVTSIEEVCHLAALVAGENHLRFDGVQAYAGHLSHEVDEQARRDRTLQNSINLRRLLTTLEKKGLPAATLSGGSTGTAAIKAKEGLYTELQAGSYLFMDATYRDLSLPFRNSLFLLTTVVSAREGLTVLDAGVKTCGVDQGLPLPVDFSVGQIVASEEHFQLHAPSRAHRLGERVRCIPGHCCSTVNLHDRIYIVDGDRVVDRLLITARGCGK